MATAIALAKLAAISPGLLAAGEGPERQQKRAQLGERNGAMADEH